MGRRQQLTVRKRRCNERQTLKQKKRQSTCLVQHVYGIQDSIAPNSCVSESSDAAMDMKRQRTQNVIDSLVNLNTMSSRMYRMLNLIKWRILKTIDSLICGTMDSAEMR